MRTRLLQAIVVVLVAVTAGCRAADVARPATPYMQSSPEVARLLEALRRDMVVVPQGRFQMGSSSGQGEDEHPVHAVSVPAFLLSRYEVTAAQYALFERATGRSPAGNAPVPGNHPAANVSWDDAVAFIDWLNGLGDLQYRLPSEAEWEYAARGGSANGYWWGEAYEPGFVNGSGLGGADRWAETAPVDSLSPNGYGLYHVLGNVWEWTTDCYFPDYGGAPDDGSARRGEETCGRVLRGGSWSDTPVWLRTSTRNWFDRTERFDYVGFRLAADLTSTTAGEGR